MTHELPPRDDDPADGQVGNALWRLRARLVTPPSQQRVDEDLTKILAAAKLHAHEAPGAHEATAAATAHHAAAPQPTSPEPAPSNVYELHPAWQAVHRIARVAAAVVLVAGVGGGIASARDGGSIAHLLGLRAADPVDMDVVGPEGSPPDVEVANDTDGSEADTPLASPEAQDGQTPADDTDAADPAAPSDGQDPDDAADGAASSDTDASSSDADGASGSDGQTGTDSDETSGGPAPSEPADDPAPEPKPAPDPTDDEPVMADAPPVDEGRIDGAGGGVPCEEDDGDCTLVPDVGEDDADTVDADAEAAEELASRRFKPPADGDAAGDGDTSSGGADGDDADGDASS